MAKKIKKSKEMQNNDNGMASFILGVVSLLLFWLPLLPIICGVTGIVLAVKQRKTYPNSMASAGFVMSIIGLCLGVLMLVAIILFVVFAVSITEATASVAAI